MFDFLQRKTKCDRCNREYSLDELFTLPLPGPSRYTFSCWECAKQIAKEYARNCSICGAEYFARRVDEGRDFFCERCYSKKNVKELHRVKNANRRTSVLGLESNLTFLEWLNILEEYNNSCAYCGGSYSDIDHVYPVSAGGGTTKENCVPCCGSCNSRKKDSRQGWFPSPPNTACSGQKRAG